MWNVILCFGAFLTASLAPLLFLGTAQPSSFGSPVLVISGPWGDTAAQIIVQAGLFEIAPDRAPLGALTTLSGPGDIENLKKNGAWFVIDGKKVAELCGV